MAENLRQFRVKSTYQLQGAYYIDIHTKNIIKWLYISCPCGLNVVLKNSLSSFRDTRFLVLSPSRNDHLDVEKS